MPRFRRPASAIPGRRPPLPRIVAVATLSALALAGCGGSSTPQRTGGHATKHSDPPAETTTTANTAKVVQSADTAAQLLVENGIGDLGEAETKAGDAPVTVATLHEVAPKDIPNPVGLTLGQLVPKMADPTQIYLVFKDDNYIVCAPGANAVYCMINDQNVVPNDKGTYGLYTTSKAVYDADQSVSGSDAGDNLLAHWPMQISDIGHTTGLNVGSYGSSSNTLPNELSTSIDSKSIWAYTGYPLTGS